MDIFKLKNLNFLHNLDREISNRTKIIQKMNSI